MNDLNYEVVGSPFKASCGNLNSNLNPQDLQHPSIVNNNTRLNNKMSTGPKSRKKSIAWTLFQKTNRLNKFKCTLCHRGISTSSGSSGNLLRHLRMKHPKVLGGTNSNLGESVIMNNNVEQHYELSANDSHNETVQAVLGIDYSTTPDTPSKSIHGSQVVHTENLQYFILEPIDENKSKEINKQILKLIVKELHPFTIVENTEFKKFVSLLNPAYTLPNHKDLKKNFLPQIYQAIVDELKCTLMDLTAVALTTDRWVSINNERYIAVTAHYLDKNFELKSSFLGCASFPEKHSSNNIAVFLQGIAAEWQLSNKVVAVVTDHVPSMINAVRECKWQHVSCFASVLNKIVNAGLAGIKPVIQKIRHTIGYFKRNTDALEVLLQIQNQMDLADLMMKIDVPTRWNSTFEMIAGFSKNKEPLQLAIKQLQLNFQLSFSDWNVIEKAIKVLIIFNSVTIEIGADTALSLSKVPHMVIFMVKYLSNFLAQDDVPTEVVSMATIFKDELQKYFKELELNTVIGQTVLLDPRFKKRGFPENTFSEAYSSLCETIISLKTEMMTEKNTQNQSEIRENAIQSEYFIDIWCEFKENEPKPRSNVSEIATAEISTFINDGYLALSNNPLTYWGNTLNQSKFPAVFELVKRRLCIPATAVPGQIMFTKHGNSLLEKRNSLTSGKLNEILFLNHNL